MPSDVKYYGYKHWTLEAVPRCFNVGKGIISRPSDIWQRNHKWHSVVKRYGLRIEVCVGPLTNEEICAWEIEWIAKEGTFSTNHSHDDLNDIGCNFTRGGDGGYRKWSEDQRQRAKVTFKRVWADPNLRQAMSATLKLAAARPEVKQSMCVGQQKRWQNFRMTKWITLICHRCMMEFQVRPSQATRKYCGLKCKYDH